MGIEIIAPVLFVGFFVAGIWIIKALGKQKKSVVEEKTPQTICLNSLSNDAERSRTELFSQIAEDYFRSNEKKKIDLYVKWLPSVEEHFETYKAVYIKPQDPKQYPEVGNNVTFLFPDK